ncbi:hypothetical protein M1N80_03850 [Peptococcaceae bacterium]|nr:hypothetical protein [Peptococcaceae bacterium]
MTLPDQPISARKVISNSLKLYFENLGSLFKIALLWVFPVFMLIVLIIYFYNLYGQGTSPFWCDFLCLILISTLPFLSWGVIAYFTANALLGKKITLRQCSQAAWQWFFPLLRTSISYGLLLFGSGMLLIGIASTNYGPLTTLGVLLAAILCFLLTIWFAFCMPVCMIEKTSPWESFKRSKFLVNKNMWHVSKVFILSLLLFSGVVGILFLLFFLLFVGAVILQILFSVITILSRSLVRLLARVILPELEVEFLPQLVEFLSHPIVGLIINASFYLLLTIIFPFLPIVFTLLYLDLRTRKEAFDSEVLTKDLSRYDFAS